MLRPGGRAVFLAAEQEALHGPLVNHGWFPTRQTRVRILGLMATMSVWQKPGG